MSIIPTRRRRSKVGPPRRPFGESADDERFGYAIEAAESLRKSAWVALARRTVLGAAFAALAAAGLSMAAALAGPIGEDPVWTYGLGVTFFVAIMIAIWEFRLSDLVAAYRNGYKDLVMPMIAGHFGSFQYDRTGCVPGYDIRESGTLPGHHWHRSEDHFSGVYSEVKIEFAEVTLLQPGRNYPMPFHRALCVRIAAWKRLAGMTILRRETGSPGVGQVELPDGLRETTPPAGNDAGGFDILASEDAEAARLATPALLEALTTLAEGLGDGTVRAAFYADCLFIAVPVDLDLFEPPPMTGSLRRYTGLRVLAGQFAAIVRIVDILKSDPNAPF